MRPRIASTRDETRTASGKSPVTLVSAVKNKFPKLCPAKPPPSGKRYWKSLPRRCSSLESATMQLRISPGGSTRYSRRNRPELPPSSVTVTIAAKSEMGRRTDGRCTNSFLRAETYSFRPRRTVERPVPPPKATTRIERPRFCGAFFMQISCGNLGRKLQSMPRRSAGRTVAFRIEQLGETRVFLQKGEVLIVASVITIFGTQLDGYFQILHGGFGFAGKAIECGHGVHNMVGLGRGLAGAIE